MIKEISLYIFVKAIGTVVLMEDTEKQVSIVNLRWLDRILSKDTVQL